jgi:hypothetical protein
MRIETVTLPAFLACALINGDTSSLNDDDMKALEVAENYVAPGRIVGCGDESFFSSYCDIPSLAGDMLEYTVMYDD